MRKIRIKKTVYESGRVSYRVQQRDFFVWKDTEPNPLLLWIGFNETSLIGHIHSSLEDAKKEVEQLKRIKKEYTESSVEFYKP